MYKNIEIADVIGSAFFYGRTKTQFTFEEIEIVFTEIRQKDQFISIENKNRSLRHIMDLIEVDNIEVDRTNDLPKNKAIQDRFERQFYRLDIETRDLLSEIVKSIFEL